VLQRRDIVCYLEQQPSAAIRYTDRVRDRRIRRITVVRGFRKYENIEPAIRTGSYRRMLFRIAVDEEVPPEGVIVAQFDQPTDAGGLFNSDVAATARASIHIYHRYRTRRSKHHLRAYHATEHPL
jgi:hypothetical protein